jgi:hypothetical protein
MAGQGRQNALDYVIVVSIPKQVEFPARPRALPAISHIAPFVRPSPRRSIKVDGPPYNQEQARRPIDHVTIGQ